MSDSNRVQLAHVRETTLGTTPTTPRMRLARFTGEDLAYNPQFVQSEEIRSDRMNIDPIKINENNQGAIRGELSFPVASSPFADWLESVFCAEWDDTPVRDNDGTADSVITDVAETGGVITCTTGDAFAVGHLIRTTGFGVAGNNGLFVITTGSATVPAVGNSLLSDEAAPAAAARVKVVGFEGGSGEISAAAGGLASSGLDLSTLGISAGMWLKIGGTGTSYRFGTEACNGWARVSGAPTSTLIPLDNLPAGWTTDAGTSKTLRVFFGDQLKNGVLTLGQTLERGFLGQGTPTYVVQRGMVAGQAEFRFNTEQVAQFSMTFSGLTGSQSTTALDASPDARTSNPVMASEIDVGRVAENGAAVGGPNYIRNLTLTINNNLRMKQAIRGDGLAGPVDIGKGDCDVNVTIETYFGSNALLTKLFAGTATNINSRIAKDSQAMVFAVPRLTFMDGTPSAGAKNQDVMLNLQSEASYDSTTGAHVLLDRLEYFEA